MAYFTQVSGIGMSSGLARGNSTIVTTHTGAEYLTMVQRCNKG